MEPNQVDANRLARLQILGLTSQAGAAGTDPEWFKSRLTSSPVIGMNFDASEERDDK